jgi:hypothetical protein
MDTDEQQFPAPPSPEWQILALGEIWKEIPAEIILEAGRKVGKMRRGYTMEVCDCCGPEFIEDESGDDWRIK